MMKRKFIIAIVEDSKIIRELLQWRLSSKKIYEVHAFSTGEDFLNETSLKPDLMIVDFNLDSEHKDAMTGLDVIQKSNNIPTIVMSGQKEIDIAVKMINHGACDYVKKDDDAVDNIEKSVSQVIEHINNNKELRRLRMKNRRDLIRVGGFVFLFLTLVYILI